LSNRLTHKKRIFEDIIVENRFSFFDHQIDKRMLLDPQDAPIMRIWMLEIIFML
jgi:hypothetical protein